MSYRFLATWLVALSALTLRPSAFAEDELALLAGLTPCELVKHYDYACEVSYTTTDDGYVLEVDRIRRGRDPGASPTRAEDGDGRRRPPVLFLPSFLAASDMWFLNYPWQSPGFLFVDAGFDVWAMNSRESNPYSYHKTLSKGDPEYWRWSFDEIGRHDVAAGIDHVLNATGASKVTLLSLSQGVTIALVLLSTRPEYNDKR
ncbi:lipase member M-like [Dermacentor andersoni]|uniref:lipase member M-like n=1 Tax=Dermacentor andersoni TaxID=34620 RepID=UPI0024164B22|nr:lipase member M-like [Dermacentor andersoni]